MGYEIYPPEDSISPEGGAEGDMGVRGCSGLVHNVLDSHAQGCEFEPQSLHGGVGQILLHHCLTPPRCNGYLAIGNAGFCRLLDHCGTLNGCQGECSSGS
jgi:hypothetical protein